MSDRHRTDQVDRRLLTAFAAFALSYVALICVDLHADDGTAPSGRAAPGHHQAWHR